MSYRIEVTYSPKSFKEMDEIDAALEAIAGSCIGSGFGGTRDISFEIADSKKAERLATKLGDLLENRGKEFTIDIDKCE